MLFSVVLTHVDVQSFLNPTDENIVVEDLSLHTHDNFVACIEYIDSFSDISQREDNGLPPGEDIQLWECWLPFLVFIVHYFEPILC